MIILFIIFIMVFAFVLQPDKETYKSKYKYAPIDQTFYWINLDKSVERKERMEKLFNKHKVKNVRIEAIDGGTDANKRACSCSASHIKAIKTFYESGEEVGIICEDDLSFEYKKYWRNNLTTVIADAPKNWDIIQLGVTTISFWPYAIIKNNKKLYIPYNPYISSAICYVINRQGASHFLDRQDKPTNCTERYIYNHVKTYTYKYPMFTYPTKNDSTLHPDHLPDHVYSKNLITQYLKYL